MDVSGQLHALALWNRTSSAHCTGGWVGSRDGRDASDRRKINYPNWNQTTVPRLSRQQPNMMLPTLFLLLVDRWN